ncbi:hypothetical protein BVRB_2g040620 isoform B [Beta vulgaris subsp. vulgaris]|nr:hypothetical protein BVRB_2g040620 isoform B [Beta vulgaris subsp. vulgaris]
MVVLSQPRSQFEYPHTIDSSILSQPRTISLSPSEDRHPESVEAFVTFGPDANTSLIPTVGLSMQGDSHVTVDDPIYHCDFNTE